MDIIKKDVEEEVQISPRTGKPIKKKYAPINKRHSDRKLEIKPLNKDCYDLDDGDNTKFMQVQIALYNMPRIDMENVEEVQNRLNEYFALYAKFDMKPTVAGMAIALNGMNKRTLWAIANDAPTGGAGYKSALPRNVSLTIKKAYFLLENLWETYMVSGKINPVVGIFLAKNNYGYQDKTEYVVTPNQKNDSDYSADEIRERYIVSDSPKRLSTEKSDS